VVCGKGVAARLLGAWSAAPRPVLPRGGARAPWWGIFQGNSLGFPWVFPGVLGSVSLVFPGFFPGLLPGPTPEIPGPPFSPPRQLWGLFWEPLKALLKPRFKTGFSSVLKPLLNPFENPKDHLGQAFSAPRSPRGSFWDEVGVVFGVEFGLRFGRGF